MTVAERFARATDRRTSQLAAEDARHASSQRCTAVLKAIATIHSLNGRLGATPYDVKVFLAQRTSWAPDQSSVARRCTTLYRAGWITEMGEREGGSKRLCTVWRLTVEGRKHLARSVESEKKEAVA